MGSVLWLAWKPSSPPQLPSSVEGLIPVWALSSACQTSPSSRCAALSHVLTHLEEEGTAIASLLYLLELGYYGKVQIFLVGLLVVFFHVFYFFLSTQGKNLVPFRPVDL